MKEHNKKRLKFIILWSLIFVLVLGLLPWLITGEASFYYIIPFGFIVIFILLLSTLMYETPTYPERKRKESEYYVPHLDNMGIHVRERAEAMLKRIHPLIKLTDEWVFGDVVIEMPAYITGSGITQVHHRKYKITFDTHHKKVKFDLYNGEIDPRLILCLSYIMIGLGWINNIDVEDFNNIIK